MKNDLPYWVFYRRLARDAYRPKKRPELLDLYKEGQATIQQAQSSIHQRVVQNDGQVLIDMSKAELAKEQALLNQIFHTNIKIDLEQPGAIKNLIDTLNACLNLKSVYERNKQLITANNGGQKGVFSFFDSYLLQAWDMRRENIKGKVMRRFVNNRDTFFNAVKQVLDDEFNKIIIPNAIKRMLNARVENGVSNSQAKVYAEILDAITKFPDNPLAIGLKQAWGIDEMINTLANDIANTAQSNLSTIFNKYGTKQVKTKRGNIKNVRINGELRGIIARNTSYRDQASGLSLEALEDQIFAMVVGEIPDFHVGSGNFIMDGSAQAKTIKGLGYKKMRPDGAVIFNMDTAEIEKEISDTPDNNRQTAVDLFNKIGRQVEGVKDGFIVYTNAKNYTLNQNFKNRGGYSAGTAMTLSVLEPQLGRFIDNVDDLITVLINAGKGAIGEGNTGEASEVLAQAIAFALFDDWDFIGNTSTGGQSIHVMNLNGVLIPLSVFLYSLGEAIRDVESDPSQFVKVNIETARYNTNEYDYFDGSNHSTFKASFRSGIYYMENWLQTPDFGKQNTKISYHFFKNIQDFLNF